MEKFEKKAIEELKSHLKSQGMPVVEADDKAREEYRKKLEQLKDRLQAAEKAASSSISARS